MKIIWLDLAEKDLEALFDYVASDRPESAGKEVERIIAAVGRLEDYPGSGRPGRVPDTRELVVSPYVVAYRVKGGKIQILRVLHSARNWPDRL